MAALNRRELRRVIREVQPDVLHTHDMRAAWTAFTAHTGLPVISHIHNNAFDSRRVSFRSIAFCLPLFGCSIFSGCPKAQCATMPFLALSEKRVRCSPTFWMCPPYTELRSRTPLLIRTMLFFLAGWILRRIPKRLCGFFPGCCKTSRSHFCVYRGRTAYACA